MTGTYYRRLTKPCGAAPLISCAALACMVESRVSAIGWRYHRLMALPDYNCLYDHACERKGGEKALKALLPKTKSQLVY